MAIERSRRYDPTNEAPGTIVIDPQRHFLYLVQGGGRTIRSGPAPRGASDGAAWMPSV
jgi:lipoprotein-anchoring transpeptidase ErfK/SrfK